MSDMDLGRKHEFHGVQPVLPVADVAASAYRGRGVGVVFPPVAQPWGLREFAVRGLNGHVLRFCGYL